MELMIITPGMTTHDAASNPLSAPWPGPSLLPARAAHEDAPRSPTNGV